MISHQWALTRVGFEDFVRKLIQHGKPYKMHVLANIIQNGNRCDTTIVFSCVLDTFFT